MFFAQGAGRLPSHATIGPNSSYVGSKQQLCQEQSAMAGAETIIPYGHVAVQAVVQRDYSPSLLRDAGQDYAKDRALELIGSSSFLCKVRSWTGIPMAKAAKFAKLFGYVSTAITVYDTYKALRDEYKACMER
jgi:hypothetical protein